MSNSSAVVAFCKNFGIGFKNKLPWKIKEDLDYFKTLTVGSDIVMGYNTFISIGSKPLPNRKNILYTTKDLGSLNKVEILNNIEVATNLEPLLNNTSQNHVYFIGGRQIYDNVIGRVHTIYATIIYKEFECDSYFPTNNMHLYEIQSYSDMKFSDEEKCYYQFVTYRLKSDTSKPQEEVYLDLLNTILNIGENKDDRTGVGTISSFGHQLKFDISKTVPILTTKQLAWKAVTKELLWFLKGDTNSKNLEKAGVNIWKGNTSREFLDKRGLSHYEEGDMGPLYSHALRFYNSEYKGCNSDYRGKGYDQMENLIKQLKEDPDSRRHVITTFNPSVVDQCVLMPCHGIAIQFYVSGSKLSCHVYCRSSDCFLGLPFNIASYTILVYIIAKKIDKTPDTLIISTGDTHIYKNHIEQVKEQLERYVLPLPILSISDRVKDVPFEEIQVDDIQLNGYIHHPSIKAPMAV